MFLKGGLNNRWTFHSSSRALSLLIVLFPLNSCTDLDNICYECTLFPGFTRTLLFIRVPNRQGGLLRLLETSCKTTVYLPVYLLVLVAKYWIIEWMLLFRMDRGAVDSADVRSGCIQRQAARRLLVHHRGTGPHHEDQETQPLCHYCGPDSRPRLEVRNKQTLS